MSKSYCQVVIMGPNHSYPVFPRIRQIESRWCLTLERLSTGRYTVLIPLNGAAHAQRMADAIKARPDDFRRWVDNGCPR
jgi:hypothetical protein